MADRYVPGEYYRICDRTGFKVRSGDTSKEWTGRIVRASSFEQRHPQDFVRGRTDNQIAQQARPRQTDTFVGPLVTEIVSAASAGAVIISVLDSTRMDAGDTLEIVLDSGDVFSAVLSSINGSDLTLGTALPGSTSAGKRVTDRSAVSTVTH